MNTAVLRGLLLNALTRGPGYGTLLGSRLTRITEGEFEPHSFRVYQALRTLVRDGLIEVEPATDGARRRARIYRLTADGWRVARASLSPTTSGGRPLP